MNFGDIIRLVFLGRQRHRDFFLLPVATGCLEEAVHHSNQILTGGPFPSPI